MPSDDENYVLPTTTLRTETSLDFLNRDSLTAWVYLHQEGGVGTKFFFPLIILALTRVFMRIIKWINCFIKYAKIGR